ncbi:MAG: HAD family phosphatase [Ruminococcaceae bacterium]|nr:HAD family phosphatase [Oscillospiraceae bacterium]
MRYKAILFDMDGVLIDSEGVMALSTIEALGHFGIRTKAEEYHPFVGKGEELYIGGVVRNHGFVYVPEMKAHTYDVYGKNIGAANCIPGAADMIREVVQAKIPHALCSGAELPKVLHNLRALGLTTADFDVILSANDVTRNKPFPDIYQKGAAELGMDPADCVVVDDTLSGVASGKAAGAYTIAVGGTYTAEEFREQGLADAFVEKPAMLTGYFRTMGFRL